MTDKPARWDLTNIFPGLESDAYNQAVDDLKARLDDLDAYMAAQSIAADAAPPDEPAALAQTIGGYLERMNALQRLFRTLQAYIHSFVTTDSYNTTARRLQSQLDMLGVRLRQQGTRFQSWVGRIADHLPQALTHPGPAQEHKRGGR